MENITAPEENEQTNGPIDGPGSQLRTARERLGVEQAKVAVQLHLSLSMIQALERDDYENLPTAVFVQGYMRNYARFLGVDEDAVLRSYQDINPHSDEAPLQINQPDDVAKELQGDHRQVRLMTATGAVFVLLAVLLFYSWQGRATLPEPEAGPVVSQEASALPSEDQSTAPQSGAVAPEIGTGSPATAPLVEESAVPAASGMVAFEFSGPCWVEVHDTTGKARLIGEMHEGIRRTLDAGLGPFQVVLGDINSASVSVNGTKIDLRSHARGKVARFSLDPSRF